MESSLRILGSNVSDYGQRITVQVEAGPLIQHKDKRFPQQRLRMVVFEVADLERAAIEQAQEIAERMPAHG